MTNTNTAATTEQIKAAFQILAAVADAIRELKTVPSGEMYARLMGRMDLRTFTAIVDRLKGAGLVAESGDVLLWVGPEIA
jgi:xanthine dehydrogenase iron-sulfur cluster and FAD-binding subunit A